MRVLVVEDEVKTARAVRRGLEHEGYAVDMASEGEDALRGLRHRPGAARRWSVNEFDLVLPAAVDIREVGMRDGLQLEEPVPLEAKLEMIEALLGALRDPEPIVQNRAAVTSTPHLCRNTRT